MQVSPHALPFLQTLQHSSKTPAQLVMASTHVDKTTAIRSLETLGIMSSQGPYGGATESHERQGLGDDSLRAHAAFEHRRIVAKRRALIDRRQTSCSARY